MLFRQDLKLESNKLLAKKSVAKKSVSKRSWQNVMGSVVLIATLSGCSALSSDHQLCDLRVLALLINQHSADAMRGSAQTIDGLKTIEEQLTRISPEVIQNVSNEQYAQKLRADIGTIQSNIKVIVDHKKTMTKIYDFSLIAAEVLPGIQAEYNLMTHTMVRDNYRASQIVIAKNQVFIAERILRSIYNLTDSNQNSIATSEDLIADIETFNTYLNAQLDGSSELGVQRINDPALRESLISIKQDADQVLMTNISQLRMKMPEMVKVQNAIKTNQEKAMDVFNTLEKIKAS